MFETKIPGVYLFDGVADPISTPSPDPTPAPAPRRIVTYQRVNGTDRTADGTLARPFRTLAAALASWPTDALGDTYVIDRTGCTDELPAGFTLSAYRDTRGALYRYPSSPYLPYVWAEAAF